MKKSQFPGRGELAGQTKIQSDPTAADTFTAV